jgi:hypothetical protein
MQELVALGTVTKPKSFGVLEVDRVWKRDVLLLREARRLAGVREPGGSSRSHRGCRRRSLFRCRPSRPDKDLVE